MRLDFENLCGTLYPKVKMIKKVTALKNPHPAPWQFYKAFGWWDFSHLAQLNQYRYGALTALQPTPPELPPSPYESSAFSRRIFRAHACALSLFPLLIIVETGSIILDRLLVIISDIIASNIGLSKSLKGGENNEEM